MSTTIRLQLVRTVLRRLLKPLSTPALPLGMQRALLDSAALVMRKPARLKVESTALGGVSARQLTPAGAAPGRHLLYLHGGAYIAGSPQSHTGLAGQVGMAASATVWLPDYRLAPEHPYPAAEDDAVAAYRALLARSIPAAAIGIVGDSAGGGLTLATALAIRAAGLPPPAALVLLSPWTDLTLSGRSMQDRQDIEPMLNVEWLDWAAGAYCGGPAVLRTHPGVSPLFADLAGLPPLLVHVGSDEILFDDATCLAERAQAAGVDATLRVFDGLWHVFQAQAGLLPEADESIAEIGAFLRARLRG